MTAAGEAECPRHGGGGGRRRGRGGEASVGPGRRCGEARRAEEGEAAERDEGQGGTTRAPHPRPVLYSVEDRNNATLRSGGGAGGSRRAATCRPRAQWRRAEP
nr:unnamed protein product [Digitaria exilis]